MWGGATALCFPSGVQSEEDTYKKSIAIQLHLFAWELPDTVLVRKRVACVGPWAAPAAGTDASLFGVEDMAHEMCRELLCPARPPCPRAGVRRDSRCSLRPWVCADVAR